jgi:hypothetical protein
MYMDFIWVNEPNDSVWYAPSWEPQEEGMVSTAASFPQYETKV